MISSRTGRLRAFTALGAAAALSGGLLAATTSQAASAPADPPASSQCPDAFPHAELEEGQQVSGVTNTRGTRLDSFGGTYVDTITDGIGRGRDMLVFTLEGSRIDDAGVWAGISGSPVYAEDGRLVGSVSYGFNEGNERLAGVTPAEYLYGVNPTASPQQVSLRSSQRALARQDVRVSSAATLRRIGTVRQVSGVTAGQLPQVRRLADRAGLSGTFVNGSAASSTSPAYPLVAGGSVGVTWSYGDITTASVGSVTAVCGDDVYAFGHPDVWDGESDQTLHGAAGVAISSGSFGSYKLANVGAPAGRLLQDRLEGILGRVGELPVTVDMKSTTTFRGRTIPGATKISEMEELPFIAAMQAYADAETAFNAVSAGGDSRIGWRIGLKRANGKVETYTRSQRFSSRSWLSEQLVEDLASDVYMLLENPFEDVSITSITVTNDLTDSYRGYTLGKVERLAKGKWKPMKANRAAPVTKGSTLRLRLTLDPIDRHAKVKKVTKNISVKLPRSAARTGRLFLSGNASTYSSVDEMDDFAELERMILSGDWEGGDDDPFLLEERPPRSFDEMVRQMRAIPRQDQVLTTVGSRPLQSPKVANRSVRSDVGAIVTGSKKFTLRFR